MVAQLFTFEVLSGGDFVIILPVTEASGVTHDEESTPPDNNQSFPNEQEQTNTGTD